MKTKIIIVMQLRYKDIKVEKSFIVEVVDSEEIFNEIKRIEDNNMFWITEELKLQHSINSNEILISVLNIINPEKLF